MKQTCIRIGVSAVLLTSGLVGALITAAPASAASRGFLIKNDGNQTLTLQSVKPVQGQFCDISNVETGTCHHYVYDYYPMAFEGRPGNGSTLRPGATARFELKWSLGDIDTAGDTQYQADLLYKIGTTGHTVEYRIQTYTTANESFCKVSDPNAGSCTAASLDLTFK